MNRHSGASSYLAVVFQALCGRIGVQGGTVLPGHLMPIGSHSDERDPKRWPVHTEHQGIIEAGGSIHKTTSLTDKSPEARVAISANAPT